MLNKQKQKVRNALVALAKYIKRQVHGEDKDKDKECDCECSRHCGCNK